MLAAIGHFLIAYSALALAPVVRSEGAATLSNAQQFVLASDHAKRDFLVQVAAPVRPLKDGEKAAVIYVLDGDYMFGMAADIARNLQIVREIAPVYVVAIGYPGDVHADWVTGRLRDLLDEEREVAGYKAGGGGKAFRRFLLEEVRPFIEARYPIDPRQAYLHGHSVGGLFAANLLLEQPDAFAGYAVGSPSIWVRPELLDKLKAKPAQPGPKPKIYVGVGSEEREEDMVGSAQQFAEVMKAKGYPVDRRVFEQEGHVTVEGVLYANALKYLIPPPPAPAKP